jgi:hypothetical protein
MVGRCRVSALDHRARANCGRWGVHAQGRVPHVGVRRHRWGRRTRHAGLPVTPIPAGGVGVVYRFGEIVAIERLASNVQIALILSGQGFILDPSSFLSSM